MTATRAAPAARVSRLGRSALASPLLLALPAVLFVGVFALWPLVDFLAGSVMARNGFTGGHFLRLLTSTTFFVVLGRTLATAAATTLICLLLAYPLAYALTKARGSLKTILLALVVLPYLTSVVVRTYAWAALLALNGPVNGALLGLGIISEPILLGHSDFGTLVGMVHILLPIAVLTLWSALEKIAPMQRTVAASLGASRAQSFLTVYLPQSVGGLVTAASLVYILALGAYVIPATLGGTRGLLFAQLVVEQATTLLNWNLAGAMGVVMLVAAALPPLAFAALSRLAGRMGGRHAIGRGQAFAARRIHPLLDRVPGAAFPLMWGGGAALVLAFLLIPELVVIAFSFGPEKQITFPPAYFTLAGYASTLSDPSWMEPLRRSAIYALADAVIATVLGAFAAYGFVRGNALAARLLTAALVAPIVLPEIVIAISYFIFASNEGLSGTAQGIILGQGAAAVGLVVVILSNIVRQVDMNLEYAARMCGASRLRTIRDVVLPLIAPGLFVAFVYGFLHAFDNLVLPLFIAGTRPTVPVRMFLSLQEELTSAPAVIASILIAGLVAVLAVTAILARTTPMRLPLIAGRDR